MQQNNSSYSMACHAKRNIITINAHTTMGVIVILSGFMLFPSNGTDNVDDTNAKREGSYQIARMHRLIRTFSVFIFKAPFPQHV